MRHRVAVSILAIVNLYSAAAVLAETSERQPSGVVLQGQVGAVRMIGENVQSELGLRLDARNASDVRVGQVDSGSAAFRAGVEQGDKLLDVKLSGEQAVLSLERDGHVFTAYVDRSVQQMPPVAPPLVPMNPRGDNRPGQPFPLQASQMNNVLQRNDVPLTTVPIQNLKLLASYDIELVVDRSMSMTRMDCPGFLTRWDWCGMQATTLARALAPYVPNGLTITTFAASHIVYPNSTPQGIVTIFTHPMFEGGTRLGEALNNRFSEYFSRRRPGGKPLLIAVITDGVPWPRYEPGLVKDELIRATQAMNDPREITVAFLQIGGHDFMGQHYLQSLDEDLVHQGAKYDIVHAKMFDSVKKTGLAQALVDTIQETLSFQKPKVEPTPWPDTSSDQMARRMRRMGRMGLTP